MIISHDAAIGFIRSNTVVDTPPLVPEIRLHLASEITPIWHATEAVLAEANVEPPFWAFAWAGGQALARYLLDHPETVAGRAVLDFGAGSGLIAIAARRAGAASVRAVDIDPMACVALRLNGELNAVAFEISSDDVIDGDPEVDLILVGDMCYERKLAERMLRWLRRLTATGVTVLIGDPGRTYRPDTGLVEVARYTVTTSLELEDRTERLGVVSKLLP